jgi:hypothetical protein
MRHIIGNPFRPAGSVTCGVCEGKGKLYLPAESDTRWCDVAKTGVLRFPCFFCFGNGWLPGESPVLPTVVTRLAESLYAGDQSAAMPLCDALIEAGHGELAEHFRAGLHPKGCWVVDLITGRC